MVSPSTEQDAWAGLPELPHTAQELSGGIVARRHHFASLLTGRRVPRRHPGPGDLGRRISASPWSMGLPHGYGETRTVGFGVLGGLSSPVPTSWAERFGARRTPTPTPQPPPSRPPVPVADVPPARPRTAPRPPAPRGNAPRRVIRRASISEGPDEPAGAASPPAAQPSAAPPASPSAASSAPASSSAARPASSAARSTPPAQRLTAPHAAPGAPAPDAEERPGASARPPAAPTSNASAARPFAASGPSIVRGAEGAPDAPVQRLVDPGDAPVPAPPRADAPRPSTPARPEPPAPRESGTSAPTAASLPESAPPIRPAQPRRVAEYGLPPAPPEETAPRPTPPVLPPDAPLGDRPRSPWGAIRSILTNRVGGPRSQAPAPSPQPPVPPSSWAPAPANSGTPTPSAQSSSSSDAAPGPVQRLAASGDNTTADRGTPRPDREDAAPSRPGQSASASRGTASEAPGATASPAPADVSPDAPVSGNDASRPASAEARPPAAPSTHAAMAEAFESPDASFSAGAPAAPLQRLIDPGADLPVAGDAAATPAAVSPAGAPGDLGVSETDDAASGATEAEAPASVGRGLPVPGMLGRALRDGMRARQSASAARTVNLDALSGLAVRASLADAGRAADSAAPAQRLPAAARGSGTTPSPASAARPAPVLPPPAADAAATRLDTAHVRAASSPAVPVTPTARDGRAGVAAARAAGPASARAVQRLVAPGSATPGSRGTAGATGLRANARRDLGTAAMVARVRSSAHISRMFADTGRAPLQPGAAAAARVRGVRVDHTPAARTAPLHLGTPAASIAARAAGVAAVQRLAAARARPASSRGALARLDARPRGDAAAGVETTPRERVTVTARLAPDVAFAAPGTALASRWAPYRVAAPSLRAAASSAPQGTPQRLSESGARVEAAPAFSAGAGGMLEARAAAHALPRASRARPLATAHVTSSSVATPVQRVTSRTSTGAPTGATEARRSSAGSAGIDPARDPSVEDSRVRAAGVVARETASNGTAGERATTSEVPAAGPRPTAAARRASASPEGRGNVGDVASRSLAASATARDRLRMPLAFAEATVGAVEPPAMPLRASNAPASAGPVAMPPVPTAAPRPLPAAVDARRAPAASTALPAASARGSAAVQRQAASPGTRPPAAASGASRVLGPHDEERGDVVAVRRSDPHLSGPAAARRGTRPGALGVALRASAAGAPAMSRRTEASRSVAIAAGHVARTARVAATGMRQPAAAPAASSALTAPRGALSPVQRLAARDARAGTRRADAPGEAALPATRSAATAPGTSAVPAPRARTAVATASDAYAVPAAHSAPPAPRGETARRAHGVLGTYVGAPSPLPRGASMPDVVAASPLSSLTSTLAGTPDLAAGASRRAAAHTSAIQRLSPGTTMRGRAASTLGRAGFASVASEPTSTGPVTSFGVPGARPLGPRSRRTAHADAAALSLPRALAGPSTFLDPTARGARPAPASVGGTGAPVSVAGAADAFPARRALRFAQAEVRVSAAARLSQRATSSGPGSMARRGATVGGAGGSEGTAAAQRLTGSGLRSAPRPSSGVAVRPGASPHALPSVHTSRGAAAVQRIALPRAGRPLPVAPAHEGRADGEGAGRALTAVARWSGAIPGAGAAALTPPRPAAAAAAGTGASAETRRVPVAGLPAVRARRTGGGASEAAQRMALPRGHRALPSITAPAADERAAEPGMRILDVPPAAGRPSSGPGAADLPVGGALSAEAALRAVAAAADYRREFGEAPASASSRGAAPSGWGAEVSAPRPATESGSAGTGGGPRADSGASTAGAVHAARQAVQRIARRPRAGLPRATGPATTASFGALPAANDRAGAPGILAIRGGRTDVTSLPVGAAGAAGAVSAARRAAADVVQTALGSLGIEADAGGAPRVPGVARAAEGDGGHSSDAPHMASSSAASAAPVQRLVDGEADEATERSAASDEERVAALMDRLEARILAQIERRGGRYRGMFS